MQVSSAAPGTTPDGPSGLGCLTTATASNGGSWANLDAFEAAKANAETLFTTVTAFVAAPATVLELSTLKAFATVGSNMPLLQSDPTQPVSRQISGVPLYPAPPSPRRIVWAHTQPNGCCSSFARTRRWSVDTSVMFTSDRVAIRTAPCA